MPSSSPTPTLLVDIIEECQVCPPSPCLSPPLQSLPLTFLDIPWLLFPPAQPLFFFQLPHPDPDPDTDPREDLFYSNVVPRLKLSLSSALQNFSPFAGKLATWPLPPANGAPDQICFSPDSPLPFTVAQSSNGDFNYLCTNSCQKSDVDFHRLVPHLPTRDSRPTYDLSMSGRTVPLMAVQVTYFPKASAFSIGIAYHQVLCDERTFNNFIYSWASSCKSGLLPLGLEPTFDRSVILDPNGLRPILLKQLWGSVKAAATTEAGVGLGVGDSGLVRATFVMRPADIVSGREWMKAQCDRKKRPYPVLLSAYVVTCALVWHCLAKARCGGPAQNHAWGGPMYFGFIAGGITRLNYRVPTHYFGNCVAFGRASAKREELLGNDGILAAADATGQTVKRLDHDVLGGADNWISEWEQLIGSDLHINVVGSPKVDLYKTDFGWGTPKKIEEISLDVMRGVSLRESRDMKGGIEVGIVLPKSKMDAFSSLFSQGLQEFSLA